MPTSPDIIGTAQAVVNSDGWQITPAEAVAIAQALILAVQGLEEGERCCGCVAVVDHLDRIRDLPAQ